MKKTYILTAIFLLITGTFSLGADVNKRMRISAESLYEEMNLQEYNLNPEALQLAVEGYEKLLEERKVSNDQYLTIADFSQPSDQKRFYLIDLVTKQLVVNTYVMHGKNSGGETPESFSNDVNSLKSSLGFYITTYTYNGSRGYSLRIKGQEEGFNTNAEKRGVVIHGSNYINEERAEKGKVARSEGCPALPKKDYTKVIKLIKGGSVFFIYSPSETYVQNSPLLNS